MSTDLPLLWSPAQQAWLQAMGYTVLHDSALAAELEAVAAATPAMAAPIELSVAPAAPAAPAAPSRRAPDAPRTAPDGGVDRPAARPPAPVMADAEVPAAVRPARAGNARQPSVRLPDRLQMALLRASGCNPNDPATQALMDSWPLDTLRGNAAAKRALWPKLRALRRKSGP